MPHKFDLWFYPEGQPYDAREKRGRYDTREEAMAAADYPDAGQWEKSGSRWILAESVVYGADRQTSWFEIDPRWVDRPEPKPSGKTIRLTLVQSGQTTVEVDAAVYADAKANGELDRLLDTAISDMETDTTVIEPDGTRINPHA